MEVELTHGVDLGARKSISARGRSTKGFSSGRSGSMAGPRGAARRPTIRDQRHPGTRWPPGRAHVYGQAAGENKENFLYLLEHPLF